MSEASDDSAEKEHEASAQKLQKAREKGELVRSADLNMTAALAGFVLAASMSGGTIMRDLGATLRLLLEQPDQMSGPFLASMAPVGGLLGATAISLLPLAVFPALLVIVSVLAQRSLVFAPTKIAPKWSRVSPFATARQKFGLSGLFEFGKSVVKLVVVSAVLAGFLISRGPQILGTLYVPPAMGMVVLGDLVIQFLLLVVLVVGIVAGVDFAWQAAQHARQNRMSRQEMLDEHKEQDGDPHTKAQRRQRGMDLATNQMLADVPRADVVIVNPTHYAVALKWDRAAGRAPVCVAKGVDEIAARIRERAIEAGVPLHGDPPAARALYATVDIGQEIGPDHYRAVAAAIRFAEAMRKRARNRGQM